MPSEYRFTMIKLKLDAKGGGDGLFYNIGLPGRVALREQEMSFYSSWRGRNEDGPNSSLAMFSNVQTQLQPHLPRAIVVLPRAPQTALDTPRRTYWAWIGNNGEEPLRFRRNS